MTNKEFKLQVKLMLKLLELKKYEDLENLLREAVDEEKD